MRRLLNEERIRYPEYLEKPYPFPLFYHVTVQYPRPRIKNLEDQVQSIVKQQLAGRKLKAGARVCVGVGSRGICDIDRITRSVIKTLRENGLKPFIIPAMGSHGGATAEGQKQLLASYGITEAYCGCPIQCEMDAVKIGDVYSEVPVYFSKLAIQADAYICINRIKPHTKFKAPLESGVIKMLAIGMGKHKGALSYHKWALKHGFYPLLREIGRFILDHTKVAFGIGVVENAYDETAQVEAIAKDDMFDREAELLKIAKRLMPRLPFSDADALIVNQIGKDISGAGMDPNITGRAVDLKEDDFSGLFKATRLAVLNLSPASKGNALGMGNADIITQKVLRDMDYEATLMNILTSVSLRKAAIPVVMPTDEMAIKAGVTTIGPVTPDSLRVIILGDTLHVSDFWISEALVQEIRGRDDIALGEKRQLTFDSAGNLTLFHELT